MSGFIPDASVALPWCFIDEATPWTEELFNRLAAGERAVVPAHWPAEVSNGLLMALRRGRIRRDQVHDFLGVLSDLSFQMELAPSPQTWPELLVLAETYRLTAYDAAYLGLARQTGLPLATLDRDLQKAARAGRVMLLEESQ